MTVGSPIGAQLIGSFVALIAMIFSGYLLQVRNLKLLATMCFSQFGLLMRRIADSNHLLF